MFYPTQILKHCWTVTKNSPTRVLAAAIYCKLEHNYFNETRSRMDIATAFHCNTSQLSKAITGIDYKSGPHHYKPKPSSKRACNSTDAAPPPKNKGTMHGRSHHIWSERNNSARQGHSRGRHAVKFKR